jgi:hypothetical protein
MKPMVVITLLLLVCSVALFSTPASAIFTFGCYRDAQCINQFYEPPCYFPPAENPCAIPCRPPGFQEQGVPCAFKTACPSVQLPCHGIGYGSFPYPLFHVR